MRRRAACSDQGGAQVHAAGVTCLRRFLQAVQGSQQGFERAVRQWLGHVFHLVAQKSIQPLCLVHAFGFVGEQYGIAVESNAHFVGVGIAGTG